MNYMTENNCSLQRFEQFGNVMIDIETLSTHTNAVVIEIAAVEFNKNSGEIGEIFHQRIKNQEWFVLKDRHVDPSTIKWWMQQSDKARNNLTDDKEDDNDIFNAIGLLTAFINRCDNPNYKEDEDERTVVVWGNGSTFDITILQNLYEEINIYPIPWKFWAVNDVRTIVALNPSVKENCKFEGTKHCAADDCKHQIKYLVETLHTIHIINSEEDDNDKPYYLDIILPSEAFEWDCVDFPWEEFLSKDTNTVTLTIDLHTSQLKGYKELNKGDFYFFMKIVDSGKYSLYNKHMSLLKTIDGYVPNKLVPKPNGYGDYIEFTISSDGTITDFAPYEMLDFSEFKL
jgi:hypothetical protein